MHEEVLGRNTVQISYSAPAFRAIFRILRCSLIDFFAN